MIKLLQNATQAIDLTTVIVALVTALATLGAAYLGFKKSKEWDIDKENRRTKNEFNKVIFNLQMELSQNRELIEDNIKLLERHTTTTPIIDLYEDSWKFAVFSGFLRRLSSVVCVKLTVIYTWVGILNRYFIHRETLTMSGVKDKSDDERLNEYDDYLIEKGKMLLLLIGEMLIELGAR